MPKYTPVTCGDGAVLARQNSAHLAHPGSFLGLALNQSESMNTLAGFAQRAQGLDQGSLLHPPPSKYSE